jgi:hypothetical protein
VQARDKRAMTEQIQRHGRRGTPQWSAGDQGHSLPFLDGNYRAQMPCFDHVPTSAKGGAARRPGRHNDAAQPQADFEAAKPDGAAFGGAGRWSDQTGTGWMSLARAPSTRPCPQVWAALPASDVASIESASWRTTPA